ncbi:thermostable hemolysin [Photobacterium profundum]|uniref:thermostable hemolysin n=1 Tax=Photobacterium profundum TaxID=74109 RepID=UPI003D0D519B
MNTNDLNTHTNLLIIDKQHAYRQDVEQYVSTRYNDAFNAKIIEFMPTFMAIYDDRQVLLSVCGFRVANQEPLFLEQYLSQPADELMTTAFDQKIDRSKLIEFGQLASFSHGMSPLHFMLMTQKLVDSGFEWCIFTATDPLYVMMCRLGLQLHVLSDANPDVIPDAESTWGTYYHHQPRVSVVNLPLGLKQLTARFSRMNAVKQYREERR